MFAEDLPLSYTRQLEPTISGENCRTWGSTLAKNDSAFSEYPRVTIGKIRLFISFTTVRNEKIFADVIVYNDGNMLFTT